MSAAMTTEHSIFDDRAEASDERRAALSYVNEAFAEALRDGVEADSFAQAALFTALQELVATYGEEPVAKYIELIPGRVRAGEYTIAMRH